MAQSNNNLYSVLKDTADAIRSKTGSSNLIVPREFADEIASISTGTSAFEVSINITNGSYIGSNIIGDNDVSIIMVEADSGYNLPSTISVSGATSYYDKDKGGIILSNPTGNVSITIICEEIIQWTFGVSGLTNSTPALTRTDDAVGKNWTKNSSTGIITSDFDNYFNFERVVHSGSTFVRIPKMYFKRTADTIQLSNYAQTGFSVHPCFLNESGQENNYYDVGCYKAVNQSNVMKSVSGVSPTHSLTLANWRTYARANNTGVDRQYFVEDMRYLSLLWMLWMVVFADRQTENIMGTTWYSYSSATTGNTDSLVNNALTYPMSICGQDPTTHSFKFFGIEDVIGAGYEYIDGVAFSSSTIQFSLKPSEYSSDTFTNYTSLSYTRPTDSRNITRMGLDTTYPAIMYPSNTNTTYTTYYCDKVNYADGTRNLNFGASFFYGNYGVFFCGGDYRFSDAYDTFRARLCSQPL